jgi:shikimate kinase
MVSGRNYLFQSDWRRCFVGNHPPIQRGLYVGPNGLDYLTIASLDGPAEVERTCLARIFPLDSDGLEGTQTSQALEPHLDTTVAPITAPSKTVALIGFSCSGKSTLGKRVVNALKVSKSGPLIHRDSDEEIGQPFGGIAELYMRLGYDAAIDYITEQERVFLRSLQYSSVPQLVVFGPNVVLRDPEWKEFLDRVKPTIVYLTVSLPVCYNRLRKRDDSAMIKYAGQPNAGCWNRGVFREPGREFPEVEAKEHLKANMRTQIERYEAVSEPARTFDAIELQKGARLAAAIQQIRDALK